MLWHICSLKFQYLNLRLFKYLLAELSRAPESFPWGFFLWVIFRSVAGNYFNYNDLKYIAFSSQMVPKGFINCHNLYTVLHYPLLKCSHPVWNTTTIQHCTVAWDWKLGSLCICNCSGKLGRLNVITWAGIWPADWS